MRISDWSSDVCSSDLVAQATGDLDAVRSGLQEVVDEELAWLDARWPTDLPAHVIHADLFPDNVLVLGDRVTGLIDFYFAATDVRAYDLAITHAAWCFSDDGSDCDPAQLGSASCRERVGPYVYILVVAGLLKKKTQK